MSAIGMVGPFQALAANAAAANASGSPNSSGSGSAPSNQLTGNSFITLLTAQLKAQDPLNPIDPTTFVTQLVQFNQLQQLIDIKQTLSTAAGSPAAASNAAQTNLSPGAGAASALSKS
jgi:flagellar basal-body rod modification protein FlgD